MPISLSENIFNGGSNYSQNSTKNRHYEIIFWVPVSFSGNLTHGMSVEASTTKKKAILEA